MNENYTPIRVVVADDHEIFRDGFAGLLKKQKDIELVGEAEDGKELIAITEKLNPDVILTDIKMPGMDGIAATKYFAKHKPHIPVIALTMFNDDNCVLDMMEAGAKGYLLKNSHKSDIIDAIRAVNNEEVYYCKETSQKLIHLMASRKNLHEDEEPVADFSSKEREVIHMICRQFSNQEMSDYLHLSVRTIEGYRKKIQEKMKVRNAVGIVIYAVKHKLYEL